MSKTLRAAAVAALSTSLVFAGGTAAFADDSGPTIEITSQVPGVIQGRDDGLTIRVTDPDGVDRYDVLWDGVSHGQVPGLWGDLGAEGAHTVKVLARDTLGNESSRTETIYIDRSGPAVTWLAPQNGALVRGKKVWTAISVTDRITFSGYLEPGTVVGPATGNQAGKLTGYVPVTTDGRYEFTWALSDGFGQHNYVSRYVTVDNTKPKLTVTKAPKNKAKVKGKVKVKAAASDRNGVAKVQLLINGKVVATDYKAGYSFTVNTKKYGKKFKVTLRAYDRAGNVTTTSTRTWRR
ncbi:hypothetical protein BJY16_001996 [Actinoplanes octamycinicus]|uniref:Ig-like domain-containing protein n=1 Tax=Actinoplanes octamycinicus TaxID=135948 RepID=A0A7W7GUL2_9ACTN|nr:Ig-like domain-containing protein [Actinoplanes octamycinicus]MBB4738537.1 hypothetical protein [Actinoplanes octamycinicus]